MNNSEGTDIENINELLIKDIKDLTPEDINDKTIDELIGLKFIIFKIMKDGLPEDPQTIQCMCESLQTSLDVCIQRLKYATEQLKGNKRND